MEKKQFNLEKYLTEGVEKIVKGILKATLKNPDASRFIAHYAAASRLAASRRHKFEAAGEHVPPFLIASITNACNLHCAGCYARANHICYDEKDTEKLMTDEEWSALFSEADKLGISFILLAGGEPMMRPDVIKKAGEYRNIIFPVFTNGTLMGQSQIKLFRDNPNLVPIISIEGGRRTTDLRRGHGVHEMLTEAMDKLKSQNIMFGASVTVTKDNADEVMGEEFVGALCSRGCKAIIYVEYVPVDRAAAASAPDDDTRCRMTLMLDKLRNENSDMLFVSFPGDEKSSGGCLAAGRGFFHINAFGGAEPCPFSAYSDTSVRSLGIREALKSPLFTTLQESGMLNDDHEGGCVLHEKEEQVKEICRKQEQ